MFHNIGFRMFWLQKRLHRFWLFSGMLDFKLVLINLFVVCCLFWRWYFHFRKKLWIVLSFVRILCCHVHLFIKHFSQNADNGNFMKIIIYLKDPTLELFVDTKTRILNSLFTKNGSEEIGFFFCKWPNGIRTLGAVVPEAPKIFVNYSTLSTIKNRIRILSKRRKKCAHFWILHASDETTYYHPVPWNEIKKGIIRLYKSMEIMNKHEMQTTHISLIARISMKTITESDDFFFDKYSQKCATFRANRGATQ